jgi:Fe-coproporphyrin III synthase
MTPADFSSERYRVLQLHPTLRCNLRCLHCYSSSGPEVSAQLDPELLGSTIAAAGQEGFNVLGISGGEPTLYRPLPALLDRAHAAGMLTTVTSNGMLLDERKLNSLRRRVDLLAISLDGSRESHDRMRAMEGSFDRMVSRLDGVRSSGIPFGFIFTLTSENVHELDWVARFALEQGAHLLQIHPLEALGRARQGTAGSPPDRTTASRAYIEAKQLQHAVGNRLHVQVDLAHTGDFGADDACILRDGACEPTSTPLASLVSPVVVEADATVVPIEYGFPRRYALGSLLDAPFGVLANRWKQHTYPAYRELYHDAVTKVRNPEAAPFANLYDIMAGVAGG